MKENILKIKSFEFAKRIVNLYKYLLSEKKEFAMSKQLLKSGTNPGTIVREAEHSQRKLDFINKLSMAQKEINETLYYIG